MSEHSTPDCICGAFDGRTPEVYYYAGEDHVLSSEAENTHHTQLLDFFARHLVG
ncbi:hypothetical protein [Salinicola endophyticus]|uniref:Dienelactone hydrolase domain-containing protein n=1 Tax=Salinicola endophyticus TaxID=1949083 RepID=A0AB74UBE9_9GAMM